MKKWLLLLLVISTAWWWQQPAGINVSAENVIQQGEYQITSLEEDFTITARVLSRKNYHFGREADLSPVDLALGWGPMADPEIIKQFSIRQSNRWYYWKTKELPIAKREVEIHSANMHMIPADSYVAEQLSNVKKNQNIQIIGKLVRVDAEDGWHWVSSLSREDTGAGACELVLVEHIIQLPD